MSLSSQASGYLSSSSSSLQTSLSSSSLTEPPLSDAHALGGGPVDPAAVGDGWEDDPAIASADDTAASAGWRSDVTLRKGWEFLESEGPAKMADLASAAAGVNRLSLAETVKTVTPSAHRSNRSSTDRHSTIEPTPVSAPSPPLSGGGGGGRTSRAASIGASASMPAHAEETASAGARPALSPSPPPPLLSAGTGGSKSSLLQTVSRGTTERPELSHHSSSTSSLARAVPQRSSTPTDQTRSASPGLCASIDAWVANVPLSPGSARRHLHHYYATGGASGGRTPDRRAQHHRSIEPPVRAETVPPRPVEAADVANSSAQTHRRAKSSLPVIRTTTEDEALAVAAATTPIRPHKPRWLQASPSFSSPNLSAQASPVTSKTKGSSQAEGSSSSPSLKPDGPSGRMRRLPPSQAASASAPAKGEQPVTTSAPALGSAPLLPPRPAAEVQKQSAEAEFTPSSASASKSGGVVPPPAHPSTSGGGSGSSGRAFVASNGLKGRLAAFGGMVGGAATQIYQEGLAGAQSSGNLAGLASGAGGGSTSMSARDATSYTSYTSQAAAPRQPTAAAKSGRGFQHAILSAPSSGVKMFNTAWKGKSASSAGPPRAELIDGEGSTPIMFNPTGSIAPGAEGRVFGRDVVAVARQWGVREGVAKKRSGSVDEVSIDGSSIDQVSRESLPALVVRCVEYLEIWGPREEGIFRISGRSTHIVKLRAQLDTGADIDLKLSDAGDLDPHAVASVFKAYLRELPSSILTAGLQPSFDVVMERFTGSSARGGEFVGGPHQRAAQESSTQSATERQAQLKRDIKELLSRLPVTCWALLKVVVGLLQHTDRHSHVNKMGIPNLLLVLCPTIGLSPPFLRLLIEHSSELFGTPPPTEQVASPTPSPVPSLPPRLAIATPGRKSPPAIINDADAPELDMPRTFPSPLPDFSVTGASPRQDDGWGSRPVSPAVQDSASLPPSPTSSTRRQTQHSSQQSARRDVGVAFPSVEGGPAPSLLEQPPSLRQRKRSIIDLANAAFSSSSSSDKTAARSTPGSTTSLAAPSPPTEQQSQQPTEDVLPPAGIVAAKKHIFSTPISDRFKSTSSVLPSFRSHTSKPAKALKPTTDPSKKPSMWNRGYGQVGSDTSEAAAATDRREAALGTTSAP